MRRLLFSVLLVPLLSLQAHAQGSSSPAASSAPATQVTLGRSLVELKGPWKFHIGDNPRWADPNFDDSQWETVLLAPKSRSFDPISGVSGYVPGWTAKDHPGYWGYAWYRIRVQVNAHPGESLALVSTANVDDIYQVFANGTLLGSFGKFPGNGKTPTTYYSQPMLFPLPQVQTAGTKTLVLALRVWMGAADLVQAPDAGGFHNAPLLGQVDAASATYQLGKLQYVRTYGSNAIEAALFLLLAIMACSLVLLDRHDHVYWWLAGVFLLTAIQAAFSCVSAWTQDIGITATSVGTDVILTPLIMGGWVMVWWTWFRLRRPAWMPTVIAVLTLLYAATDALGEDLFISVIPLHVGAAFHLASVVIRILFLVPLVLIVIWGVRERGWDGWLALPAVVLVAIAQFQTELSVLHVRVFWFPFAVRIGLGQIANATLVAVLFVLLIRRLLLSLSQQRQMALDVKQAQEVQQVLIPEELPKIPGLAIESEYRPAREVGGDFFQIIPHPSDSSVLVVAGDVTGKGLQAGMLVALIVGAIRATAQYEFDPLAVLHSLNQRLCGRGNAHATCLALRISSDGSVKLANAGHLPPWLNGKELPMDGALPLGMTPTAEFSVMRFQLQPEDRLLLLSDGVAEAQNEHRQLFGFDRIRELLAKPVTVAEVAAAAQTFGQQDDISVLSVTRMAVLEHAVA
ncbi:MAG TPA: SpoIIE family protein phosphatase [Terracidiphilus sp.]|nr:SpoIIE family protein phosphatase [Terracidiphilus sp.]